MSAARLDAAVSRSLKPTIDQAIAASAAPCRCAVCLSDVPHLARCRSTGRVEAGGGKR